MEAGRSEFSAGRPEEYGKRYDRILAAGRKENQRTRGKVAKKRKTPSSTDWKPIKRIICFFSTILTCRSAIICPKRTCESARTDKRWPEVFAIQSADKCTVIFSVSSKLSNDAAWMFSRALPRLSAESRFFPDRSYFCFPFLPVWTVTHIYETNVCQSYKSIDFFVFFDKIDNESIEMSVWWNGRHRRLKIFR